jgi:mRNA interferase MazF
MKEYDDWNEIKKFQEYKKARTRNVFCKEREIWWVVLGLNIGDEEDGKGIMFERPVLIVKKFNNNLFWGCALSSKIKDNNKYYMKVIIKGGVRSVILSQLRLYDVKRLQEKIDVLNKEKFNEITTAIKNLL